MKLDCILTACNLKPLYIEFIPYFINMCKKLYPDVDVKIVLIADSIPEEYIQYSDNIILYNPPPNISTCFISQYIRILYPAILNYENGVLITDIDDVPLNNKYFTKNIRNIPNHKWVNLREWKTKDQICMAYQVATPINWKEVFGIKSIECINERLTSVYSQINYKDGSTSGDWFKDQRDLYTYVMDWNKKTNNYIFLRDKETGFNRLGRNRHFNINEIKDDIKNGKYSDYHCLRPYSKYKIINDKIYDML
tara:strand:+ start:1077 stop:1829 length:753 start_codon:yes stop_codon:yes gene_type:complete